MRPSLTGTGNEGVPLGILRLQLQQQVANDRLHENDQLWLREATTRDMFMLRAQADRVNNVGAPASLPLPTRQS